MRRLSGGREHLDGTLVDRAALAGNLRDLRRINRLFGGTGLSVRAMRELLDATEAWPGPSATTLTVLDVGTGAADIPIALSRARGPWRSVRVTAVDSRPEVVEGALAISPGLASEPSVSVAVADGLALPYPNGAFHVAHASLLLHHLEPVEAMRLLRELGRVAQLGVVINDLSRSRLAWLGAWLLLHVMTRNRFTLHDGPISVRRAYTRHEVRDLLAEAGLRPVREVVGLLGHRWAMAAVAR